MSEAYRLLIPLPDVLRKLFADLWLPKISEAALEGLLRYFLPGVSQDIATGAAILIGLDTVTGCWAAFVSGKTISSARFARVLTKLLGYGSVVVVCAVAAHTISGATDVQAIAVSGVLGYVITTEGISILENVGHMGVKAPPALMAWLRQRVIEANEEKKSEDKNSGT